jgi:cation transport regulator ChaC
MKMSTTTRKTKRTKRVNYFAYGSNLNPAQMERRCPGTRMVGIGTLVAARISFTGYSMGWQGGVATLLEDDDEMVQGVVWSIPVDEVPVLDRCEGVAAGIYTKEMMTIRLEQGGEVEALVYVHTETRYSNPSTLYMTSILNGYQTFGFDPHPLQSWNQ